MIMLFKEPLLIVLFILSILLIPCIIFTKYGYIFGFAFLISLVSFVVFSFFKETTFLELAVEVLIISFIFLILLVLKKRGKENDI